jgi:hypothetical protein
MSVDAMPFMPSPITCHHQVSFFRANLTFKVLPKPAKGNADDGSPQAWHVLLEYIKQQPRGASGIVYCLSRQDTMDVAGWVACLLQHPVEAVQGRVGGRLPSISLTTARACRPPAAACVYKPQWLRLYCHSG